MSLMFNSYSKFSFLVLKYSTLYKDEVGCLFVVWIEVLMEIWIFKRLVENFVFVGTQPS